MSMNSMKHGISVLFRFFLAFVAMLIAYVVSAMIVGDLGIELSDAQQAEAGRALLIVALLCSLILSFLVLRTRYWGFKLVATLFLIQFGVETFMTQIETLYFNSALQLDGRQLLGIVETGALRALIFAPLAALIFGKLREPAILTIADSSRHHEGGLGGRVTAVALLYVLVYFLFGYFVAWQWEELRVFYTGSAAIKSFFVHFRDLFFAEDPFMLPFQVFRGLLWAGLTLLIVNIIETKRWVASAAAALVFSVLMTVPMALFPNPYMPPMVIQAHSVEVGSSMLLFGALAGWMLYRRR